MRLLILAFAELTISFGLNAEHVLEMAAGEKQCANNDEGRETPPVQSTAEGSKPVRTTQSMNFIQRKMRRDAGSFIDEGNDDHKDTQVQAPSQLQSGAAAENNAMGVVSLRANIDDCKNRVCSKEEVTDCFQKETERLRRQEMVESVFALGGGADLGSGIHKFNKKRKSLMQANVSHENEFVMAVVGGIAAIGGAAASFAHANENANAANCVEKGFEAVLDGINDIKDTTQQILGAVQGLETTMSTNHQEVLAGQTALQQEFKRGVTRLETHQKHMFQEAKAFRAEVEHSIGRLDDQLINVVRNQNTLSLQLDQLSLQLYGTEMKLLTEQFSKSAVSVISAAKVITGSVEDVQDIEGQVYDHRAVLASLSLEGATAKVNAMKWAAAEKEQMMTLKDVVSRAWTRTKDAISLIAVTLSEGDFLQKYFMEGLRLAAEDYVKTYSATHSGQCGGIIQPSLQPLLTHMSSSVLADNNLIDVLLGSVVQAHDVFKTMVLIFGRNSVSPAQYKDSLVTINHAVMTLQDDYKDPEKVLKLVQDMLSPVLTVLCPLSAGCRDAAFASNHVVSGSRGVKIDSRTIAFEPLSYIKLASEDAAFYDCQEQSMTIPATIQGGKTKTDIMDPTEVRGAYYTPGQLPQDYNDCSSTQTTYQFSCAQGYELFEGGGDGEPYKFSCHKRTAGCPMPNCDHYYIEWKVNFQGHGTQRVKDTHFLCKRKENTNSHRLATKKTNSQASAYVDSNYAAWNLGGDAWDGAVATTVNTLSSAIEDSVMRLFLLSNNQKCAEALPHGNLATISGDTVSRHWDRKTPYFCWDCVLEPHEQWLQEVHVDGHPERDFRLVWKFDERLTLKQRLEKAVSVGVSVKWAAYWGGDQSKEIEGTWRFSRAAKTGGNSFDTHDNGLSGDDGAWAAGQYVDGELHHASGMQFGSMNQNAGDNTCNNLWVNGQKYSNSVFTSHMYVVY